MRREIKDLGNGLEEVIFFFDKDKVFHKYQKLNGKLHGEETWFYENGQIREKRNWVDGKLHGKEILYYENGRIERKYYWINGVLKRKNSYNEWGKLIYTVVRY